MIITDRELFRGGNTIQNFCGMHKDWDGEPLTDMVINGSQTVIQGQGCFTNQRSPWVIPPIL